MCWRAEFTIDDRSFHRKRNLFPRNIFRMSKLQFVPPVSVLLSPLLRFEWICCLQPYHLTPDLGFRKSIPTVVVKTVVPLIAKFAWRKGIRSTTDRGSSPYEGSLHPRAPG